MIYHHIATNLSGQSLDAYIDLSKAVAIEPSSLGALVHLQGLRKPVEVIMTDADQFLRLINAWEGYKAGAL